MVILKILGMLVAIGCLIYGLWRFNDHCESKFGYEFVTSGWFMSATLGGVLLLLGN